MYFKSVSLIRNAGHCHTWTQTFRKLTGNHVMQYDWAFHRGSPK